MKGENNFNLPERYSQIVRWSDNEKLKISGLVDIVLPLIEAHIPDVSVDPEVQEIVYGDWIKYVRYGNFREAVLRLMLGYFSPKWKGHDLFGEIKREATMMCSTFNNGYQLVQKYYRKTGEIPLLKEVNVKGHSIAQVIQSGLNVTSKTLPTRYREMPKHDRDKIFKQVFNFSKDATVPQIVDETKKNFRNAKDRAWRKSTGFQIRVYNQWYNRDSVSQIIAKIRAEYMRKNGKAPGERDAKFRMQCVKELTDKGFGTKLIAEELGISEGMVRRYRRQLRETDDS